MSEHATRHSILRTEMLADDGSADAVSLRVFCKRRGHSVPVAECMGCERLQHATLTSDVELSSIECDDTSGVLLPSDAQSEPVGAILSGRVVCVSEDMSVTDVVANMVNLGMEDAPVIDPEGRYFGVIRESGLVISDKSASVKSALTRSAAVSEGDTVYDAVVRMARTHQRKIPVLSGNGVVVGVLRDVDAIKWLTQARERR